MTDAPWHAWYMVSPGAPFERREVPAAAPAPDEAVVAVAGCGVCHTDLSFLYQGVKTRQAPPLVLGHEISGTVAQVGAAGDPARLGQPVVVPAVLPCGTCELCQAGHRRICRQQIMPGNDRDGGYASHVIVPARYLCPVPEAALAEHRLWELAVVADAVATPFQAVRRSGLAAGDFAVCIGVGGIGIYGVQVAAATGAKVLALDVDDRKLELARAGGADATLNVRGAAVKDLRRQVRAMAEQLGGPPHCWKIFETSGTRAGQELAWALLGFGATLSVVGFTSDRLELPLSNLMAYDATAQGNWGADPVLYPELLQWIGEGRIRLTPFVEAHPLERINEVFAAAHQGGLTRRAILRPDPADRA